METIYNTLYLHSRIECMQVGYEANYRN